MFPTKLIDLQMSPSAHDFELAMSAQPLYWQTQAKDSNPSRTFLRPFNSEPDKKLRQQMLDEVNREADLIMKECNLFLEEEPITDFSDSKINYSKQSTGYNIFQEIALDQNRSPLTQEKCQGRLKFFDEQKNYGFIIMDRDGSDIFVYQDDLQKTGLTKEFLKTAKYGNLIRFSFTPMEYFGKYQKSRKAIDLEYIKPTQQQSNPFMLMIPTLRM